MREPGGAAGGGDAAPAIRRASSRTIRKIAAVALARKLLVALWRYIGTGLVPGGARLKAAA